MYSHKLTEENAQQGQATGEALADTVKRLALDARAVGHVPHAESIAELAERHAEQTRKIFHDSEVK